MALITLNIEISYSQSGTSYARNTALQIEENILIEKRGYKKEIIELLEHYLRMQDPTKKNLRVINYAIIDSQKKEKVTAKSSESHKSIWRTPLWLIPFRLFWYFVKSLFNTIWWVIKQIN